MREGPMDQDLSDNDPPRSTWGIAPPAPPLAPPEPESYAEPGPWQHHHEPQLPPPAPPRASETPRRPRLGAVALVWALIGALVGGGIAGGIVASVDGHNNTTS